jgi:hypothetical protein
VPVDGTGQRGGIGWRRKMIRGKKNAYTSSGRAGFVRMRDVNVEGRRCGRGIFAIGWGDGRGGGWRLKWLPTGD